MSDYGTPPPPPPGDGPGQYSGMESMPGYQAPVAGAPVAQPASIAMAVKLMYVGAALSLVGLLSTFLMRGTIRDAVQKASDTSTTHLTSSQVDAAVGVAVGLGVVSGLVGVALWLWMAAANGKGRKWARILATIFFACSVLSTLGSLAQHPPVLSLVVSIISLVLGAYIIYLLYRPESTQYYAAQSAPRV
ncbi:hypothetical protein [Nostocoides sp. HKS02]|uniref:hypothetical protein n=1 Tax=Nostocoides sp. HKS02 TaxID=1813880 RepID=UPI0012B4685C|nr:hypothetical protein [Tetrasphaera sp. HKS02]QGN58954.1 hypothetical protein GKE56_14840 [Tetrasphaera sp. HKS02]